MAKREGKPLRMKKGEGPLVQGYMYQNDWDTEGSGTVCQILGRAEPLESFDFVPRFVVQFGDGFVAEVLGESLHPWYAT